MNNYKPIFYNEKLLFYREEKNGYMLISLKEFPELREMVINRTMWKSFYYVMAIIHWRIS